MQKYSSKKGIVLLWVQENSTDHEDIVESDTISEDFLEFKYLDYEITELNPVLHRFHCEAIVDWFVGGEWFTSYSSSIPNLKSLLKGYSFRDVEIKAVLYYIASLNRNDLCGDFFNSSFLRVGRSSVKLSR